MSADARCVELIDIEADQIRPLLAPLLHGAQVRSVVRVDGGLVNTVYRVTPANGAPRLALRVYAGGAEAFDRECRILSGAATAPIPVPRPEHHRRADR